MITFVEVNHYLTHKIVSMNDFELKEQETINRLLDSDLSKSPFSVTPHARWHTSTSVIEFNILISYKSTNVAVVEIMQSLQDAQSIEMAKIKIRDACHIHNCPLGIITDNIDFYIFEINNKDYYQKCTSDNVVNNILNHKFVHDLIYEQKYNCIKNVLENNGLKTFTKCFNKNDGNFYFKRNKEEIFWKQLLIQKHLTSTIYRYTSLETAFLILKNMTYRMYGIVSMNDKSEIDYVDAYCNTKTNTSSNQLLNNSFISSCSILKDNLTMWRLYGDDAKGACLVFDIKTDSQKDFIIHEVSYADQQGNDPKLDIIKHLTQNDVIFKDIDKWKHFFKSKDYSIEEEVRLIFQDTFKSSIVKNRDWIKTNDYSIINPYVEFDLFNTPQFPLQLKEIILGPKCPERETNIYQLQELIRRQKLTISVKASNIKNYR